MICPICKSTTALITSSPSGRNEDDVNCSFCGNYFISDSLQALLPTLLLKNDASRKLSYNIRKSHETQKKTFLNTDSVEAILQQKLPHPKEQADLMIKWLAKNSSGPGERSTISYLTHGAIVSAKSDDGFTFLLEHLTAKNHISLVDNSTLAGSSFEATLTFDGWDYYESLTDGFTSYRRAFMAMQFGVPELDDLLSSTLKPAVKKAGFELLKLDDSPKAGLIDTRMRVEIRTADFVIVDLTHENRGAYWEAGYAEGLGKPVIYICETSKFDADGTHFDTAHHLTLKWDIKNPRAFGNLLTATIRATLPHLANLIDD